LFDWSLNPSQYSDRKTAKIIPKIDEKFHWDRFLAVSFMSLRYRLFLIVSGLFIIVAVCSSISENYVAHRELAKAQDGVRKKLLDLSEKRRVDLQSYLAATIAENEVRIDAILNNISSFSPQVLRFGPSSYNMQNGTWGDAADLLLEYKWIDFLQNTNEGKTTAAIVPQLSLAGSAYRIDIDQDLCWVYLGDLKTHSDPYIAVRVPYSLSAQSFHAHDGEVAEQTSGVVPSAFLLFEVKDMLAMETAGPPILQMTDRQSWPPIPVNWAEGYVLEVDPFVRAFRRAREWIQNGKIKPPECTSQEIVEKMDGIAAAQGGKLNAIPAEPLLSSVSTEKAMKQKLEEISLRYTQISMIWGMIALYDTGIFGHELFSFPSPSASALFSLDNDVGFGVKTKEVMFSKPLFDDCDYYAHNASKEANSSLASSIAVIPSPASDHVFFGNTVRLNMKTPTSERTGFLTIASDADTILQRLVLAIHQAAILYVDKPLSAFGMDGEKIDARSQLALPFAQMLAAPSGIVPWKGENYFYLHLKPFPDIDLHIFLLNPEAKEFALLHDLVTGSQQVIHSILLNIHIAGLVGLAIAILLLHNISRRITRPIIQLAKATDDIVEGRLDQIKLTLPPLKHHDEIAILCHSFEEMVKGLQEKEKVKGVLNKVVSREIAQEILKGSIHLGGEEKIVTVLFADIRDFTKTTQNMNPQDVIELLNTCMTKISYIIDKNGGVIDKYVGDEAMALFGAPIFCKDAALKAICSAIEMVESLQQWNKERASRGLPAIEMGIGIHTGPMLAGNMGAENRLNYTVIGSNVNLAARLCNAAKRMEILISKDTLDEPSVKDGILEEEIPPMALRGFDQPVKVFRVKGLKR
jgi:class 3 adenylate cyclase